MWRVTALLAAFALVTTTHVAVRRQEPPALDLFFAADAQFPDTALLR